MTNFLYNYGKEGILGGDIAWDTDTFKAVLGRAYTQSVAHQFRSDAVTAGLITIATSASFTSKTIVNGVAAAANLNFPSVAAGPAVLCLLIYKDTGASATDRLIAHFDTGTGFPLTPTGADVPVVWSVNGVFAL